MAAKASTRITEESFGVDPRNPSLGKGSIEIFGHTVHDGEKFPPARPVSSNTKTGYPGDQK